MDLIGNWQLKVVGTGIGGYRIITELVDSQNHQTSTIEGMASMGLINSYILHYPAQTGKPLEITHVKS